uniref:Uncharacterized protein n=1 Tax=Romanomermis culicivorax TaxID=13658 RepID=A0A915KS29_ROMCU
MFFWPNYHACFYNVCELVNNPIQIDENTQKVLLGYDHQSKSSTIQGPDEEPAYRYDEQATGRRPTDRPTNKSSRDDGGGHFHDEPMITRVKIKERAIYQECFSTSGNKLYQMLTFQGEQNFLFSTNEVLQT